MNGHWVLTVDRETGEATTQLVLDRAEAWALALELETPELYTTVVKR